MPKVLMVGHNIDPYPPHNEAIKNQCRWLAEGLRRRGWTVSFLSRSGGHAPSVTRFDGMRVVRLPSTSSPARTRAWSAIGLAAIELWLRPDVIHFWGAHALLPIPPRAPGAGPTRLVVSLYRPPSGDRGQQLLQRLADWPLRMVAEDESLVPVIRAADSVPAAIVPPGVDTEHLLPRERPADRATWFGYFASAPINKSGDDEVAYLASRGVQLGLKLGDRLAALVPFHQVLLWRSPVTPQVQELVAASPSTTVVQTVVPDLADYIGRFDLCFMLSDSSPRSKAIPLSAVEALARGIPVVARAGSPLSLAIEDAGAGFVVDEHELERAAFEIVAVLTEPGAYEAMAMRARKLACQRFSLEQMVLAYERIYRGG